MGQFPNQSEAAREARLRRRADRQGFLLRKSRSRRWSIDNHGGFMIVDARNGVVVAGERYDLDPEAVELWLSDE